jgi:hypothetical protein
MQIHTATLLASQQLVQPQARPVPGFAADLEKSEGFQPLPLKKTAHADQIPPAAPAQPGSARLGAALDIKI